MPMVFLQNELNAGLEQSRSYLIFEQFKLRNKFILRMLYSQIWTNDSDDNSVSKTESFGTLTCYTGSRFQNLMVLISLAGFCPVQKNMFA